MEYLYNNQKSKSRRRILRRNMTKAEKKVWSYLRRRQVGGLRFLRQYSIGKYIIDFYCPAKKIAIEIDGGQHFKDTKKYDDEREIFLEEKGVKTLRFWNNEIFNNIEGILFRIREELDLNN